MADLGVLISSVGLLVVVITFLDYGVQAQGNKKHSLITALHCYIIRTSMIYLVCYGKLTEISLKGQRENL